MELSFNRIGKRHGDAKLKGFCVALTILALVFASLRAHAQDPFTSELGSGGASADSKKSQGRHSADKDAIPPSLSIPVTPLGFAPPAAFYLGDRFAQVSLNFLDENTLLFTFRVPGLIAREPVAPGEPLQDQRHIRALTLSLPEGKVTAEALWVLHDYSRYLWVLKGGRFLLRDRNSIQIGDASLHLEPYLRFPGPVSLIELDPEQSLLVADTSEPPASDRTTESRDEREVDSASQSSAAATIASNGRLDLDFQKAGTSTQGLVRILDMDTRKVMLFSRVNGTVHLPVDGEGYYAALRGKETNWMISFEHFKGASTPLGWVESTCNPALEALAPGVVLASACTATGARRLTVLTRNREIEHARLWDISLSPTKVWPLVEHSTDGLRLARATLEVSHPIGPYSPLDDSDIRGQSVQVYDVSTGKVELTVPASPILDAGGNFALSPSGKRFAVLYSGAIQIFDLPPPPPLPAQLAFQANSPKP